MGFIVDYNQDIPTSCWECPFKSVITQKEIFCEARKTHIIPPKDTRDKGCTILGQSRGDDWLND